MQKIFILLLIMIVSSTLVAKPNPKKIKFRNALEKRIYEIERQIKPGKIIEFLKQCDDEIKMGIKIEKPISSIKISTFATSAKSYYNYRWFVADTGMNKKWFGKIYKLLAYMSKATRYIQTAKFNGRTKTTRYKKAAEYLAVAYARFKKLISKPVKEEEKIRREAQSIKVFWQEKMRKKYKIKEKKWDE